MAKTTKTTKKAAKKTATKKVAAPKKAAPKKAAPNKAKAVKPVTVEAVAAKKLTAEMSKVAMEKVNLVLGNCAAQIHNLIDVVLPDVNVPQATMEKFVKSLSNLEAQAIRVNLFTSKKYKSFSRGIEKTQAKKQQILDKIAKLQAELEK